MVDLAAPDRAVEENVRRTRSRLVVAVLPFVLTAAILDMGCGQKAASDELAVTYYYRPG